MNEEIQKLLYKTKSLIFLFKVKKALVVSYPEDVCWTGYVDNVRENSLWQFNIVL